MTQRTDFFNCSTFVLDFSYQGKIPKRKVGESGSKVSKVEKLLHTMMFANYILDLFRSTPPPGNSGGNSFLSEMHESSHMIFLQMIK